MKQKLLFFFLTAFLSLTGGGKLWADQVTFNTTSGNLTTPQDEISIFWAGDGSDLQKDNLKIPKGSTLTISTSSRFIQSIEMTLREKNSDNNEDVYATQYVTANVGSTAYDDTNKKYTWTGIAKSIVFTNANVDGARDFRPVSIKVTYTTTDPSSVNDETVQTYPYTWDFNSSADLWASSIEQLSVYTDEWNHITDDGKDEYRPKVERTNWGYNIDIVKGLRFDQTRDWKPCLDYKNRQVYVNSTTITIPNVKAGQKISVTGNVTISAHTNTTPVTETAGSLYEYTVDADDDVTLTFGESWIKTISVLKTDINFGSLGGSNNTTDVIGAPNWNYAFTFRDPNSATTVMSMNSGEWSNVTFSLPNTDVITFTKNGLDADNNRGSITIHPVAAGSVVMNVSFTGSDRYNAKEGTITFTITKKTQTLTFADAAKAVDFGQAAPTNTLTQTPATGGGAVTYSSSDTHVASVNPTTGALTIDNSGTCIITATAAETGNYLSATASYTLTVNGSITPTITMKKGGTTVGQGATVETTYDNSIIVTGESSVGLPVKYRSENTSIATVDASGKIVTKNGGTVKIYVYTEGSENINPVETYYNLVINPSSFSMTFVPNSGTINKGKTITPYVTLPSVYAEDVTEITANSNNTGIATVVTKIWDKNNPSYDYLVVKEENGKHKIERIKPTITGIDAGTTTISLTLSSSQYISSTPAIYTITVADDSDLHFDWANKSTLTMYEGDYMMMPAITGNANGYPFEQNNAQRYVWAMTQDNDHVTSLNWYNTNYHPGEGEPFYWLTDNGGGDEYNKLAYILYAESSEARTGTHPEGLMIYARKAGTVEIHAKDLQLDQELISTITLHILPKANIYGNKDNGDASDGLLTVEQKSITYPYTWDFTKNFSMTDLDANSYYWTKSGSTYSNGLALQNSDYGDDNHDGTNAGSQRLYKAILANGNTIPAFKGMTVQLQGTYFNSKYDKITLKPTAGDGNSHLHVTGGPQYFQLPAPATSGTDPEEYRVYVKAKPTQPNRGEIRLIAGGNNDYWFVNEKGQFNDDGIYWAPVVRGQDIKVAFQDVDVYWIAVSTEEKNVVRPLNQNSNLSYAAASYSYNADLDLSKSAEVNSGVTAYYASSYGYKADAAATGTAGCAVVMTPITTKVPANTGLILKKNTTEASTSCYMIANGKNVESYTDPTALGTNYLKATPTDGGTVSSNETIDSKKYTNFTMAYAYKMYRDPMDAGSAYTGYLFDRDWSFYRIMGDVYFSPQKSYLQIPGNLYVDRDGNIVQGASRRAADDNRPSTKPMLDIIYEDEPLGDSGVTGITSVSDRLIDNDAWYTLQGIRVDAPAKGGIYIHNGRKVVIK